MLKVKVAPSILAGDFARMGETVKTLEECGADYIHCDVMDGNFVPTITFGDQMIRFGDQMIRHIRPYTSLPLDCHLMVLRPETRLEGFARAGANMATIHVEECRENTVQMLRLIKNYGMKASAVINPNTPVESYRGGRRHHGRERQRRHFRGRERHRCGEHGVPFERYEGDDRQIEGRMKAIILLNGEPYRGAIAEGYVYCCDGAYKWAKDKVRIDENLGDYDSLPIIPTPAPKEIYPSEKNETDGEIALHRAIAAGATSITASPSTAAEGRGRITSSEIYTFSMPRTKRACAPR